MLSSASIVPSSFLTFFISSFTTSVISDSRFASRATSSLAAFDALTENAAIDKTVVTATVKIARNIINSFFCVIIVLPFAAYCGMSFALPSICTRSPVFKVKVSPSAFKSLFAVDLPEFAIAIEPVPVMVYVPSAMSVPTV